MTWNMILAYAVETDETDEWLRLPRIQFDDCCSRLSLRFGSVSCDAPCYNPFAFVFILLVLDKHPLQMSKGASGSAKAKIAPASAITDRKTRSKAD